MTIELAWIAKRGDGREHLYVAADSRTRGSMVLDCCPKILTLPRSDCVICFAGNTAATYPLMMQLATAIDSHKPARERSLDVRTLRAHLLRVFTDLVNSVEDSACPIEPSDVQCIFAGYSWLTKSFEIWTIYYSKRDERFYARTAKRFHSLLEKAAFIGDMSSQVRSRRSGGRLMARFGRYHR